EGFIYEINDKGNKTPLIGASVKLGDTNVGTTTDLVGHFRIDNSDAHADTIQVSYIGFETKTIALEEKGVVEITLNTGHQLETVEVVYKKRTTEVSFIKSINSETITREELCKAACCNLSESFETNPSVDVSFPDAITGTRQIQMLGLAGPYVQITRELMPDVRAMSTIYGLSMTPGPWIQSIQLIKGAGSVVNGFESLTGQINVELKKPERGDKFFLNGYMNAAGRTELNSNYRHDVGENVATGFLLHAKQMTAVHDNNGDGFTDMPKEKDFIIANRWKFKRAKNFEGQLGFKYSSLSHQGGSHDHFSGANQNHEEHWRMNNDTDRYEAWAKVGYVNPETPKSSVGLQFSAVRQNQKSMFGNDVYDNDQNSLFANLIFQHIPDENNIIRMGLTYQYDDIYEHVGRAGFFNRDESIPGAYFEYTYKDNKKWSVIPGIRVDKHNVFGVFVTPRLHAKYNFSDKSIVRISGGRGQKTASIFAENLGLFSSSREVVINGNGSNDMYGLDAEVAWNYGINYTQGIDISDRELIISFDAYRTSFENQIVVDLETPGRVSFYNLEGSSYSNSVQLKLEYPVLKNLDVRMAYRMFDVKTTYGNELLEKPMVSKHRSFINVAYKTDSDWHFDATLNWNGQKRLPNTSSNPIEYQRPDRSPDYFILNAQIMKRWGKKWDVYLGAENLLNYQQRDAIIAGDDAFGQYFDASIVWAPLFGANLYVGFRYTLTEE
ncbi:MAG: TonB-dependent receptor, partial [Bacteroidia bacterium]|nr:TonB-dependent receptor [Bacteroidia bacterium]